MDDVRFPRPIALRLRATHRRMVASAWEALEVLQGQWPAWARGRSYRSALRACRDALDGWRSAETARSRFEAAARRAGILAGEQA